MDDIVLGINCYDELLLRSDFITYTRKNFPTIIAPAKLLFYSKRLNIYVYENEEYKIFVKFLIDSQE